MSCIERTTVSFSFVLQILRSFRSRWTDETRSFVSSGIWAFGFVKGMKDRNRRQAIHLDIKEKDHDLARRFLDSFSFFVMATAAVITMSFSYNLRKDPKPSYKGVTFPNYLGNLHAQAEVASPRKRRKLKDEALAMKERYYDPEGPRFDQVMLANEIVCGGMPPQWYIEQHRDDLTEYQLRTGRDLRPFIKVTEYIDRFGLDFDIPKLTHSFGVIDLKGEMVQGRSLTAKRIDGKDVEPEREPGADEMSWREWRKLSRACNLLLEAVDGVPWGWEMEDEEWEAFSKAEEMFSEDNSNHPKYIKDLEDWNNF